MKRQAEGGSEGEKERRREGEREAVESVPADTAPGFSSLPLISATGFIVYLQ